jgi:hypothetical protein
VSIDISEDNMSWPLIPLTTSGIQLKNNKYVFNTGKSSLDTLKNNNRDVTSGPKTL